MTAVLRLFSAPDPGLLTAALDHLQPRHPALRARIVDGRLTLDTFSLDTDMDRAELVALTVDVANRIREAAGA